MTYDVLLQWRTPRFQLKTKWFRKVKAGSLTEACNLVLAQQDYLCQSVSMCWPCLIKQ